MSYGRGCGWAREAIGSLIECSLAAGFREAAPWGTQPPLPLPTKPGKLLAGWASPSEALVLDGVPCSFHCEVPSPAPPAHSGAPSLPRLCLCLTPCSSAPHPEVPQPSC